MIPAVPVPKKSGILIPVEMRLKPEWHFDPRQHVFKSRSGDKFAPDHNLPKNSKIVYKVPSPAKASSAKLSEEERELGRYMQIILPAGESPKDYLRVIRSWPCVENAEAGPEVSLPAGRL